MFALIINWIVTIRTVHLLPNHNNDVCDRLITSEYSNHLSFHQNRLITSHLVKLSIATFVTREQRNAKIMASSSSGVTSRLGLADAWGKLRSLRFNQDQSCFICALDDGIRVFSIDPIRELTHLRHELVGSVSKAEMLYKTNLVALVGGGKKPRFPDNVVMVYDDRSQEFVLELCLPETVLSVRLKRDKLVAVCRSEIHGNHHLRGYHSHYVTHFLNFIFSVFSFPNKCQNLFKVTTRDNPRGICELSSIRQGVMDTSIGNHFELQLV